FESDHLPQLQVPAKNHLRHAAPHPGGNALENRVVFEAPARDGAPRLGDDVVVGMVATQLRLLKAWMQFYLVDDRQNARLVEQVLQSYGKIGRASCRERV